MADSIQFLLNGEKVSVTDADPCLSVLYYLRESHKLTGTKEGCAEGDCGACTVVIGELADDGLAAELKAVNACIQFLPTLDGKALYTVEHLRQAGGALHPVQQSMIDCNGSQCGFCTPGFIMSLWSVYAQHQSKGSQPEQAEVKSALTGNLCRCTGYRPILDAAQKMFELPSVAFNFDELKSKLVDIQRDTALGYTFKGCDFHAPKTIAELSKLKAQYPAATILAGGTDVGLWVNKQFRELNPIIYIGEVAELKKITVDQSKMTIGAGASLSKVYGEISKHYPEMDEMWERFASTPIRNVGTLGGNVANGSPIGDSMPALIVLAAEVTLRSESGARTLLLEDFYLDYMKKDLQPEEIVAAIDLPLPTAGQNFRCYKLSKRYDSDISAVFAAFSLTLNKDNVESIRIAYGGMAATPKRATLCEQSLVGQPWGEASVQNAMQVMARDYSPMSDGRASDANRMQSAANLLYRFYLETRSDNPLNNSSVNVFANEDTFA